MTWVRRLVGVALLAGVMVGGWQFAAKNATPVSIDYVFGQIEGVTLWQALLGAFASGALLVGVLHLYGVLKHGLVTRRYRKAVDGLEAEVHQLRNLPLAPEESAPNDSDSANPVPVTPDGALGRGST